MLLLISYYYEIYISCAFPFPYNMFCESRDVIFCPEFPGCWLYPPPNTFCLSGGCILLISGEMRWFNCFAINGKELFNSIFLCCCNESTVTSSPIFTCLCAGGRCNYGTTICPVLYITPCTECALYVVALVGAEPFSSVGVGIELGSRFTGT